MNTTTDSPLAFESGIVLDLFKYAILIGAFLYVIFAFIVTRQISLMKNTLITSFSPVLTLVGWLHLLISIMVFIIFLLIL